jgi:hypothetical protein
METQEAGVVWQFAPSRKSTETVEFPIFVWPVEVSWSVGESVLGQVQRWAPKKPASAFDVSWSDELPTVA